MNRLTDECGRVTNGPALPWEWAKIKKERMELTEEVLGQVALEEIRKKMNRLKLTGKPRLRISPKRNGTGHWYVITVGPWSIRTKSWDNLVYRAAYGPWSRKIEDRRAYKRTRP